MNKADLIIAVAEAYRKKKKDAEKFVDILFEEIENCLARGEEVKISGFGVFQVKSRKSRTGTSPVGAHERITIPATKTVGFRPSKNLKQSIK